jgi:acyl-CoA reductase-like NAD-dependent aldehyde dehydrogenase
MNGYPQTSADGRPLPAYRMYIDGKWADARTGQTYERISPYDGTVVGVYPDADEGDTDLAIAAARRAFDGGTWRFAPAAKRAAVLKRAAALVRERADTLAATLVRELGQPNQRGPVAQAADTLEYYAHLVVDRRDEAITEQHMDAMGIIAKEPVGVVGALTAWNSPMSIAHKACPALAAGCTVVAKPAHFTPGTVLQFAQILDEAGLPPGAFNVVTSARENGAVAGQAIARSPDVDMIAFTGSTVTARKIMAAAAGNLKKLNLELGGKAPNIVFDSVSALDTAIAIIAKATLGLAGQSCVAGTRLLLQESIKDEFLAGLAEKFRAVRMGDPADPQTTMGPLVSAEQLKRVEAYAAAGSQSAHLVLGGSRPRQPGLDAGHFFEPTIFADVPPSARIAQEEIFGPVLSVLTFADAEDAVRLANQTVYGLASGIWAGDISTALRVAKRVRAGVVWVNGYRDGSVLKAMPYGGFKQSGVGRERGREGLDAFLEVKSIMINLAS